MKRVIGIAALSAGLCLSQVVQGQSNEERAVEKGMKAIELMDNGQLDESIKLLEEAQKLDPKRFDYPYEMAFALYRKKEYKAAVKTLEKVAGHKDVNDRFYQLLGNSYDMTGKPDKAIATYQAGLKKFPDSGNLYLEMGVIQMGRKDYSKALAYFEEGIRRAPAFPSNYYWASKIYCSSTEEVWGMIYGELFMNLERGSPRTAEISKILYDTYKSEIKFTSDTSMTVSFCQRMTMPVSKDTDLKNLKLPFCLIYEPTLLLAVAPEKGVDLNSLHQIRSRFLDFYYEKDFQQTYPNVLFEYQQKVKQAGHLEAYNNWILMKGDEGAFEKWHDANQPKWDAFTSWFSANKIQLDDSHKFYSQQY